MLNSAPFKSLSENNIKLRTSREFKAKNHDKVRTVEAQVPTKNMNKAEKRSTPGNVIIRK